MADIENEVTKVREGALLGLLSKKAHIKNNEGKVLSDILGWECILHTDDKVCYQFYESLDTLCTTELVPIESPVGARIFSTYEINIEEALEILNSMNCGDTFVDIELYWPLTPECDEPYWHMITTLGNYIIIGANSGNSSFQQLQEVPNKIQVIPERVHSVICKTQSTTSFKRRVAMGKFSLINETNENLRVAVFKKSYKRPNMKIAIWDVESIPRNGGSVDVEIPTTYDVYCNYPRNITDPEDPYGGIRTGMIRIDLETARFIVQDESTTDGNDIVANISRQFTDLAPDEIQIDNHSCKAVWGHILMNGQDVYPPRLITPGRTLMEDVRTPMYLGIIDQYVFKGDTIVQEELSTEPKPVFSGSTVTVKGSKWTGYALE